MPGRDGGVQVETGSDQISAARVQADSMVRGVFAAQGVEAAGGQRLRLAPDALHVAYPGIRVQFVRSERPVAGLFDPVFHSQPVEQRSLSLRLGIRLS